MLAGRALLGAVEPVQYPGCTDGHLPTLRPRGGRMRRQSTKARETSVTRKRLMWSLLAERGAQCEGCPVTPVGNRREPRLWGDMHEILTRGRGGDPTDPENILCLCRTCHDWITTHETEARTLGLVRGRTAEEHQAQFKPWLKAEPRI